MPSVSSRPAENQVLVLGLSAMNPMSIEHAQKLGEQILAECNFVRQEQARMHGHRTPPLDTIPTFGLPERGPQEGQSAAPPAARSHRRPGQQSSHQGSHAAQQTAAVHSSADDHGHE